MQKQFLLPCRVCLPNCFAMLNILVSKSVLLFERSPRMKHWLSGATPVSSHRAFLWYDNSPCGSTLRCCQCRESSFTLSSWSLPTLLTMGCGASARRYAEATEQRKEENEAGRSILLQDSRAIAVVDPQQEFFFYPGQFFIQRTCFHLKICVFWFHREKSCRISMKLLQEVISRSETFEI